MTTEQTASATLTIPVRAESGMRCSGCVSRVCAEVEGIAGVLRVECDPRGQMRVDFDQELVSLDELEATAARYGAELAGVYEHAVWRVTGLD